MGSSRRSGRIAVTVFAGLAAALATAWSVAAETDFPVIGGPGNGGFEDRCPPPVNT